MAENNNVEVKEDLEKEITCSICHEHYKEPKILPCCHYYCKNCVSLLAQKAGSGKPFSCPECRKDGTLPEGGVDSLPTAFFINRMKAIHTKLEKAPVRHISDKCELCTDDKPEAFCQQCEKYICEDCIKSHKKLKVFFDHVVKPLEREEVEDVVVKEPSYQPCKMHAEELLKHYCYDCSCPVCISCTLNAHKDHHHELCEVAVPEIKKKLYKQIVSLKTLENDLAQSVKNIDSTKCDLVAQGDSITEEIRSTFVELCKIIKTCENSLLIEAATKVTQKLKRLSVQEKSLTAAQVTVQGVIEFSEQCLQHSTDDDLLHMHGEIQSRLDRTLYEEEKERDCLEPVELADLELALNNSAENVSKLLDNIKISRQAIDCILSGKGVNYAEVYNVSAEIHNVSEFQVALNHSIPPIRALLVECDLKSVKHGVIIKCEVTKSKTSKYNIRFVPTVQGHHELFLTVNGQQVVGSPFSVFVSIDPTQMVRPVKPAIAVQYNGYITVDDSSNEIIVVSGTSIKVLDWSGKELRVSNAQAVALYGVTVDSVNDCYYATGNDRLLRLSRQDFNQFNTLRVSNSFFQGITVVRDEVVVCDYYSCIKVFTKELKYVRSIGSYGTDAQQIKGIRDVSSDSLGNIYVTDNSKSGICVFSNDGTFLRSFTTYSTSGASKYEAQNVCMTAQYIYVAGGTTTTTEYRRYETRTTHNYHVSIFTLQGKIVATLINEYRYKVHGLCIDKDNFLYV